jgi:archaellum biogenesis ATPase FlaH
MSALTTPVFERTTTLKPPSRYELVDVWDLLRTDTSPQEWLVDGLMPHPSTNLIVGAGGTSKSWFAQSMAVALSAGMPVFGSLTVPQPRSVLYVQSESCREGMRTRLRRLVAGYRLNEVDIRERFQTLLNTSFRLDDEEDRRWIKNEIRTRTIDLVIFDPLVDMHTGDENETTMNGVILFLRELRDQCQTSSIVIHHSPKVSTGSNGVNRSRGSGVIWTSMDGRWVIEATRDGWSKVANPYHKELAPRSGFRFRTLDDGDGTEVEFEWLGDGETPAKTTHWSEKQFLKKARELGEFGYKELQEVSPFEKSTTYRYVQKLLKNDKLIKLEPEKYGRTTRHRFRVA